MFGNILSGRAAKDHAAAGSGPAAADAVCIRTGIPAGGTGLSDDAAACLTGNVMGMVDETCRADDLKTLKGYIRQIAEYVVIDGIHEALSEDQA